MLSCVCEDDFECQPLCKVMKLCCLVPVKMFLYAIFIMFCLVIFQFPPGDKRHSRRRKNSHKSTGTNDNEHGEYIVFAENLTSQLYLQVKSHYVFWFLFRTFLSHPLSKFNVV